MVRDPTSDAILERGFVCLLQALAGIIPFSRVCILHINDCSCNICIISGLQVKLYLLSLALSLLPPPPSPTATSPGSAVWILLCEPRRRQVLEFLPLERCQADGAPPSRRGAAQLRLQRWMMLMLVVRPAADSLEAQTRVQHSTAAVIIHGHSLDSHFTKLLYGGLVWFTRPPPPRLLPSFSPRLVSREKLTCCLRLAI